MVDAALKKHFELIAVGEHIDSIAWDEVGTSSNPERTASWAGADGLVDG